MFLKKMPPQGRQNALKQAPQPHTVHRLLPKAKGLRPIANLGKRTKLVRVRHVLCPIWRAELLVKGSAGWQHQVVAFCQSDARELARST